MSNGPTRPCTNVGQPGTQVLLPTPIPANVTCVLSGYTQTGNIITASVISNTTGTAVATISGTGIPPTAMTTTGTSSGSPVAVFNSGTDTFYVTVASNYPQESPRVILQNVNLAAGTTDYAGSYTFIAEDGPATGDCDFNDCTCYLTWNLFSG